MNTEPRILFLSPYDAMSHQYWRDSVLGALTKAGQYQFEVVTLPPRYFSWRFRGNSLTLSADPRLAQQFDLMIATSMTDLSALIGMQPKLAGVPSILYFHENQFAYPDSSPETHLLERQITSIYSAVAATRLLFNSEFNRSSFFNGMADLTKRLPDGVPKGLREQLERKSMVLPVLIDQAIKSTVQSKPRSAAEPVSIIWNHRWEYDKGMEELLGLLKALLLASGGEPSFKFHFVGQSFRRQPKQATEIIDLLTNAGCLGRAGFIEGRAEYLQLLSETDIVLSTARHEFQGLAVLEAVAAGCVPVVPDALAYRDFIHAKQRYADQDAAVALLLKAMSDVRAQKERPISYAQGLMDEATHQATWAKLVSEMLA